MHNNVPPGLPLDPNLSAEQLANLASQRQDLWSQILEHPNLYPELREWILAQTPLQAPVAATQPSEPHPEPRKAKGVGKWVGIGAGAVALLALVGVGGWWFFSQGSSVSATPVSHAPTSARVVDVSPVGESLNLVPLSTDRAFLEEDDLYLVGLADDASDLVTIAAVNDVTTSASPDWGVVVPRESVQEGCGFVGGNVTCGTGENLVSWNVSGPEPEQLDPTAPDADVEENGVEEDSDDAEEGPDGESQAGPSSTVSHLVGAAATEDVPYSIVGNQLIHESGTVLGTDLPQGPFWAAQVGDSSKWVISNGTLVLGVDGKKELWDVTLPDGAGELNGFTGEGEPHWLVSGAALLLATSDGISARDVTDGSEIWSIETPVSSWSSDGETLMVVGDGELAIMSFGDEVGESEELVIRGGGDGVAEWLASAFSPSPMRPIQAVTSGNWTVDRLTGLVVEEGTPGAKFVSFGTGAVSPVMEELGEIMWVGQNFLTTLEGEVYAWSSEDGSVTGPVNDSYGLVAPVLQMYETEYTLCEARIDNPAASCPENRQATVLYQDGSVYRVSVVAPPGEDFEPRLISPSGERVVWLEDNWGRMTAVTDNGQVYVSQRGETMENLSFGGQKVEQACYNSTDGIVGLTEGGAVMAHLSNGDSFSATPTELLPAGASPVRQLVCAPFTASSSRMLAITPRLFAVLDDGSVLLYKSEEEATWSDVTFASDVVYAAPDAFVTSTDQLIALSSQEGWGLSALATASLR